MSILSSVALGWLGRRIPDWGGWIVAAVGFGMAIYSQLDPETQQAFGTAIQQIITGNWREISLGHIATIIGVVLLAWSQRKSFKSTVRPQIVTPQGARVELDQLPPDAQHEVLVTAAQAKPRRTIANVIIDALARKRG